MKNSRQKITGILLAGGMSSRMGHEKGSIMIGGRMMYEYPLMALESVCDTILISTSRPLSGNISYPMIEDQVSRIGPMGGIHSCLSHSTTDLNLVLSYDMPLVNRGLLSHLAAKSGEWEMVLPSMQPGRPEPLCGLYRKSTRTAFETLIKQQRYAVHQVIPMVNSLVLNIKPEMPFYHPALFLNINSKEDLKRLPENFGNES